MQVICYSNLPR